MNIAPTIPHPLLRFVSRVIQHQAAPGVLLMLATAAALVVANAGVSWYGALLETPAVVGIGEWKIHKPLLLWVNDGLMAVFFLLIGLELKREILFGNLSNLRQVSLPLLAALGGLVVPSAIYAFINWGDPIAMNGWAIPAATDIAFALGIVAILGSRVPVALKVLLTSVAVIDDLAAIVIIAVFYTSQLSPLSLGIAAVVLGALAVLNRLGVKSMAAFVLLGIVLWIAVLKSGVHATLAGVALAAFIPAGKHAADKSAMVYRLEHGLHPWVVFGVLPIFAFGNAGVPIVGLSPESLLASVPLGIALGLFVGKQIGVFGASWLAVKSGIAQLPSGITWAQVYGMAVLCGIGFTMSLFIGSLAFEGGGGPDYAVDDRIGILVGSFFSAVAGIVLLWISCPIRSEVDDRPLDGGLTGPQRVQESHVTSPSLEE